MSQILEELKQLSYSATQQTAVLENFIRTKQKEMKDRNEKLLAQDEKDRNDIEKTKQEIKQLEMRAAELEKLDAFMSGKLDISLDT